MRYDVFYAERSAGRKGAAGRARRDVDAFDASCDHLVVLDRDTPEAPAIVATYRLLRQDAAERGPGFYTAHEYDLEPLLASHPGLRFLELGRSCVLGPYRTKRTVELLWHGIWSYVLHHGMDVMIGCASLDGTDLQRLALPLSFLHHHARAPEAWRARALPARHVRMDILERQAVDPKAALHALPPLIKGYLRLGAGYGDGAVIDEEFGTTDVFVVLPVSAINTRYLHHFGPAADRHAVRRPAGDLFSDISGP